MKKEIKKNEREKIFLKKIETAMSFEETNGLLDDMVTITQKLEKDMDEFLKGMDSPLDSIDDVFNLCRITAIRDTLCWVLGRGSLWILNKKIEDACNKNKKQGDLKK